MTAIDDAVLREAPLSIILDLRRKPIVEPLSPLLGPFQSRSQNGSFQEGAALLVPFQSRSQNGSFQVRSSFQEGADDGTPLPPARTISKPKPKRSIPGGSSPARTISKPKPKWSIPGPFFIPRESCSSSPPFVLHRPRRSSSISETLFPSFEDLRRFLHLPSLRNASVLSLSFGWRGGGGRAQYSNVDRKTKNFLLATSTLTRSFHAI